VTGAISIDPSFNLRSPGETIATHGAMTEIEINTANATTTGTNLLVQNVGANPNNIFIFNANSGSGHITNAAATTNPNSYYDIFVGSLSATGALQYTQYGDWSQCSANCLPSGGGTATTVNGVFVWGNATAPASIPTAGTYTYVGETQGVYIDATGAKVPTYATVSATANYSAHTIAFSASSTLLNPFTPGQTNAPTLDMSGTLTYAAGQNLFTGTVTSAAMSGTAAGRFNGPVAQEVGGVFSLSGGGAGQYGIFYAK
jgi:hypothetical protein